MPLLLPVRMLVLLTLVLIAGGLLAGCGGSVTTTAPFTVTTGPPTPTTTPASPGTTLSESEVVTIAETLVDDMARGDFAAATTRFDDVMKRALTEILLAGSWRSMEQQLGAFQKRVSTRVEVSGVYRVAYVTTRFASATMVVKVVFARTGKISGLFFTPETAASAYKSPSYVDAGAFTQTEVTVGTGTWALPGTLTIPRGTGPFPAVVLVHGSGPNDRDETLGPNKPFKDLAEGLSSRGIVVLRYEKRTKYYAEAVIGLMDTFTVQEEVVEDAVAALTLLMARSEVDPAHVFVLGHSLGGTLAPRIGLSKRDVAGLIVLAGPTRPLEDIILDQTRYVMSIAGQPSDADQATLKTLETQVARVKDPGLSTAVPARDLPLGISAAYWLDLRAYKPVETAVALAKPMLILQGGRDYQVNTADFDGWKAGLTGLAGMESVLFPGLNHLFMTGTGKSVPSEYNVPGNVAPEVIESIASFVRKVSGAPGGQG
jgi:uncharacterized protein